MVFWSFLATQCLCCCPSLFTSPSPDFGDLKKTWRGCEDPPSPPRMSSSSGQGFLRIWETGILTQIRVCCSHQFDTHNCLHCWLGRSSSPFFPRGIISTLYLEDVCFFLLLKAFSVLLRQWFLTLTILLQKPLFHIGHSGPAWAARLYWSFCLIPLFPPDTFYWWWQRYSTFSS